MKPLCAEMKRYPQIGVEENGNSCNSETAPRVGGKLRSGKVNLKKTVFDFVRANNAVHFYFFSSFTVLVFFPSKTFSFYFDLKMRSIFAAVLFFSPL